jgi:hypothetical protein
MEMRLFFRTVFVGVVLILLGGSSLTQPPAPAAPPAMSLWTPAFLSEVFGPSFVTPGLGKAGVLTSVSFYARPPHRFHGGEAAGLILQLLRGPLALAANDPDWMGGVTVSVEGANFTWSDSRSATEIASGGADGFSFTARMIRGRNVVLKGRMIIHGGANPSTEFKITFTRPVRPPTCRS